MNKALPGRGWSPEISLFAGDVRCNEHAVLICMHTLFLREHNRICDELKKQNRERLNSMLPGRRDEWLFQHARRQVIAKMQIITFLEFLPVLLGENAMGPYRGYNSNVNPSVSNFFAHVAYRLGHSMVSPQIQLMPVKGNKNSSLDLEEIFWKPQIIDNKFVNSVLNGLWQQKMQEIDTSTVDGLRNHLFRTQIEGVPDQVLDLAALNIQRGRDHGFPNYNLCRIAFGLAPKKCINDVSSDPVTQFRLAKAYENDVNLIDPWIGGLAEDHLPGAQVGELIFYSLREQFQRLRHGDRFWYQAEGSGFSTQEISELESQTSLARILKDNTNVRPQTENVFMVAEPA